MRKLKAWLYGYYWFIVKPYLKPTIIISFGIAWMITNGIWYVLAFTATGWLQWFARGYIVMLYFPFTIEKIFTVAIALWLQKKLFNKGVGYEN